MIYDCDVTIIGAGPYGLAAAAHLRAAGIEARVFGEPMSFWENQMPAGMFLRSNWPASHIADPNHELTLDDYCRHDGNHLPKPIPLERFIAYGHWYQKKAVPNLERRQVLSLDAAGTAFKLSLADGEEYISRRVVVATGIGAFVNRPAEFVAIPSALASHSSEHNNLAKFKGCSVVVIGAGQSALESAALLKEAGSKVEVIARQTKLNWVGLHARLHHLGLLSSLLYSDRDVGPAGISRLVAMPHLFRLLPRQFQARTAYRAIRPAGSAWLQPRLKEVPITLGRKVISARPTGSQLRVTLDDKTERVVDHALLATGFRVDISRYKFLSQSLLGQLKTVNGYPVLRRGLESSVTGLHFLGKPAAWSFGPLLGFVSGAEFASNELVRGIREGNGKH
ncbi:MAG TPA: NAD(P)-binding domain-containing protein [Terriglobales bacterium]|nr:NAD(P)-binding domain-containing protein [Terriglobales bacterium]